MMRIEDTESWRWRCEEGVSQDTGAGSEVECCSSQIWMVVAMRCDPANLATVSM
jgi:hypothetical protein